MVSQEAKKILIYPQFIFFSPGFASNKWLPQLTGDPINRDPLYSWDFLFFSPSLQGRGTGHSKRQSKRSVVFQLSTKLLE
jgi:hypothetical protein